MTVSARRGRRGDGGRRARWRGWWCGAHDRPVSRSVPRRARILIALAVLPLAACSGGDRQGRQEPDLGELEAQIAQLRLEVQSLRREVGRLRTAVDPVTGSVTTTTLPG